MTSPIERAADAMHADDCPEDPDPGESCACIGPYYDRLARIAFESIDPDDLAQVLADEGWTCEYHAPDPTCTGCPPLHRAAADAVIAHLTGKDQT